MQLHNTDFRIANWPSNIQTIICDPPYNIGFNYKNGYKDNLKEKDYKILISDLLNYSYKQSNLNSNMFLINYPEITANLWSTIKNTDWNIHQWINWVYPTNVGLSKKKFTKASRTILWLTKVNSKIYIDKVLQPYKEPNHIKVRNNKKQGTNLYDWWEINTVKHQNKEYKGYVNQIPEEILKRLILITTDEKDLVVDPMCGTGSTLLVANELKRNAWGCDVNKDLIDLWDSYVHKR